MDRATTRHSVKIRLQAGVFSADRAVPAPAGAAGFEAMDLALRALYATLPSRLTPADPDHPELGTDSIAWVELHSADGRRIIIEDDDQRGLEWLRELVASITVLDESTHPVPHG